MKILLLSDNHGHWDARIECYAAQADEVWHAGDLGSGVLEHLEKLAIFRGVYGNIDGAEVRQRLPQVQRFEVGGVRVLMEHIGGYPPRYVPGMLEKIEAYRPQVFISGHSHILKVMPDTSRGLLHLNPGACGHHGWHKIRTMLRFRIDSGRVQDLEVIELGTRGQKSLEK